MLIQLLLMITVKKVVFSVVVTNQSGALLPYAYYAHQLKLYLQERLPSISKFFMAYFLLISAFHGPLTE